MGRIRTIKPEFHTHEELSSLPPETHLLAGALINYADDEGYFNAHPKLIKAGTNPLRADKTKIEKQIEQLVAIGYIQIVRSDTQQFGKIINFLKHQRISHATPSKIKPKFEAVASGSFPEMFRNVSGVPPFIREQGMEEEGEQGRERTLPSAEMIAQGVLTELCLAGRDLLVVLIDVCRAEIEHGRDPAELRDALIASWREYLKAKPRLSYPKKPMNFFGDGDWKSRDGWPWKSREEPPPVFVTLEKKMQAQEEGAKCATH